MESMFPYPSKASISLSSIWRKRWLWGAEYWVGTSDAMPKRIILFIFGRPFVKEDIKLLCKAWFLILLMMFHFRSFGSVYTSQSDGTQKSHMIFQITFDICLQLSSNFYGIINDIICIYSLTNKEPLLYQIFLYTRRPKKQWLERS